MKSIPRATRWLSILALVSLGACGGKQVHPSQMPSDALYERGVAAFEAERYGRAAEYLEYFVQRAVGDPRLPQAHFTLARSYMGQKEYLSAANEYQRLVSGYISHALAPAARFGVCEAYTRLSPAPQLDQEYTRAAVLHCESVASLYPGTQDAEKATEYVTDLRTKLAAKLYESAMYYHKRKLYDAAIVYLTDVVDQYPATRYAPLALLKLAETYDVVGYEEEAAEARERLRNEYPQSPEARALRA